MSMLFMVAIGAGIGAFTNYIAIKMLFRPYRALYIGKWRVPFTPGVIPNRRDEMAEQMGKMVVEHLLTPESIRKKFLNDKFQTDMVDFVLRKWVSFKSSSDMTIAYLLEKMGIEDSKLKVEEKFDEVIELTYGRVIEKYRDRSIESILTPAIIEKAEGKLPLISRYILGKGIDYFESPEGKLRVQRMLDDFMKDRGMFGNMMQMLLGNVNLVDKIQPELIKFLKNEGTEDMLTSLLKKEWDKVLQWDVRTLETQFEKANLLSFVKQASKKLINIELLLNKPFKDFPIDDVVIEDFVGKAVMMAGDWLANKVDDIMEKLHLKEVVQEQVESFSVERLEMMVLSIIQKEFKMITFLGGVLGGVIGLVQAFILLMSR